MSFPGFANTTPRLLRDPTESEQAQARDMVANRHADTRESDYRIALATIVNMSAAFEANNRLQPGAAMRSSGTCPAPLSAGRPEGERLPTNSHEAQSGVAEAKEAAAWHWECKRKAAR